MFDNRPKRGRPRSGASERASDAQGGQSNGRARGRGRPTRALDATAAATATMVTARGAADARALALTAPPPRTLLGKINSHLVCALCRGYFVDATTIVECLHTFCRSCILKHLAVKSYCPVCEMMINSAKPNIKLDKTLQDIVYKLVPGLFRNEMARRRAFFAARPDAAADATPEQRGEDTERVVFSPDDVISFSLEYAEGSGGGDKPELDDSTPESRRYLRCPAVVQISHLKKFLALKFDVDEAQFYVEVLYKRVPLPDHYTLMDVAYIYNWKRVEPMRFFYRIADVSEAPRRTSPKLIEPPSVPSPDEPSEDEKSQFLNSFQLTAIGPVPEKRSRTPPLPGERDADGPEPKKCKPSTESSTETEAPKPPDEPEKKKPEEPAEKKPEAPRLDPLPPKKKPSAEPGRLERSLLKIHHKPTQQVDASKSTTEKKPPPAAVETPPKTQTSTSTTPAPPVESDRNIRSLFDSCNINIPPSLSITLKDQEPDAKRSEDASKVAEKTAPQNPKPKQSTEEGHLEIIKLPDTENSTTDPPTPKPPNSLPSKTPTKSTATASTSKPRTESTPTGAKGPVPNLKPISEAKLSSPSSKPQTFQQTFLQSLQQHKEKPKFNKTRLVLPKTGPLSSSTKPPEPRERSAPPPAPRPFSEASSFPKAVKLDSALDLSAPHPARTELGPQQAKALETMQSIAILADQRINQQRSLTPSSFARNAPKPPQSQLRVPVPPKPTGPAPNQSPNGIPKLFPNYYQPQKRPMVRSPGDAGPSRSPKSQPVASPTSIQREQNDRFQTRSPSSSPKLVIACPSPKSQSPERRQFPPPRSRESQMTPNLMGIDSKQKKIQPPNKPSSSSNKTAESPGGDFARTNPMSQAQSYLRQQLELQTHLGLLPPGAAVEWYNNPVARAHFEKVINNIRNNAQASYGNNHGAKDK